MTKPPLIYIASPYSNADTADSTEKRVKDSFDLGQLVLAKGYFPVCPLASHYINHYWESLDSEMPALFWYSYDLELLRICKGILVNGKSTGVIIETLYALEHSIPVYDSIMALPDNPAGKEYISCLTTMGL